LANQTLYFFFPFLQGQLPACLCQVNLGMNNSRGICADAFCLLAHPFGLLAHFDPFGSLEVKKLGLPNCPFPSPFLPFVHLLFAALRLHAQ
jgi:hypothetical protein